MSLDTVVKQVVRGNAIYHRILVLDARVSPAKPFDPDAGAGAGVNSVRVTYYTPDGLPHPNVTDVLMTKKLGYLGEFEFTYQSLDVDPLGIWSTSVRITHQGFISKTPKTHRFEMLLA